MATEKIEKAEVKTDKKLENKVDSLCAVVRKLKKQCEKHWGVDIDEDGKIGSAKVGLVALAGVLCICASVIAADLVNYPTPSGGTGFSVDDSGNATIGGTITSSGALSAAGITSSGALATGTDTSATSVTNGQAVTVSGGTYLANSTGGANATTNTITLARPSGGEIVFLTNASSATNLLAVAKTGAYNGTALELAAGETAILVGVANADGTGTNAWAGVEL